MKRSARLLSTVIALLASAGLVGIGMVSFYDQTAKVRPVVPPFDIFWCEKNEDCVIVDRIGCCECEGGGAQGAINKWHTDDLRLFLKSACRPAPVCVQIDLCRHDLAPLCDDHRCQVVTGAEKVTTNK